MAIGSDTYVHRKTTCSWRRVSIQSNLPKRGDIVHTRNNNNIRSRKSSRTKQNMEDWCTCSDYIQVHSYLSEITGPVLH